MFDAIRINKKLIIGPTLIFLLLGIAILAIYISNRDSIGNEDGKAADPVYDCTPGNHYVDVSQCAEYANYANVSSANSAVFFNTILGRAYGTSGIGDNEQVIVRIPAANFYIYGDQEFINLGAHVDYKNLTLEGIGNGPVFQVPPNYTTNMPYMLFIDQQRHPTLKNLQFKSNNKVKFTGDAIIKITNTNNEVVIDGLKCSGTKGVTSDKASTCLRIAHVSNNQGIEPDSAVLKNSEFSDIHTGAVLFFLKKVIVRNNTFNNTNPNHGYKGANVQMVLYGINKQNNQDWSVVENNKFFSANKCTDIGNDLTQCDLTHGQTQLGLIGENNKVRIRSNTLIGAQDTAMYFSPHNPGTPIGQKLGCVASGYSKEVIIENNTIQGSMLTSLALLFQPDRDVCTTGGADKVIIRDNNINGFVDQTYIDQYPNYLERTTIGNGGGIAIHTVAHTPITGLEVYKNNISNMTNLQTETWAQSMGGSCLSLGGLNGKNNNAEDIKIYNNTLTNCKSGIYFWRAFWPYVNEVNGKVGPYDWSLYGAQSTPNNYLTLFSNKVIQTNASYSDILYQNGNIKGIGNVSTLKLANNEINSPNSAPNGSKRCNASCTSNSNCLTNSNIAYPDYQDILPGYSNGYSCYQSSTCRNISNLSDNDCDLNNSYSPPNQGTVGTPIFNPTGQTFDNNIQVRLSSSTFGADIRYTLDGSTPTESSTLYISPINLNSTTTIKAKAFKFNYSASNVSSATYTKQVTSTVATPTITPNGGTFTNSINVTIATTTAGATIHYTTDGSVPTETSSTYSGTLTFNQTTTLKAKAFKSGSNPSGVASATFTKESPPAVVEAPVFQPSGGSFTNTITVTITSATTGAQIRYTTNGSEPTESSTLYSSPLNFTQTTTLKAKAYKSGMTASSTTTAIYTKEIPGTVNPPVFQPNGGTFTNSVTVTVTTSTSGATIRYTTNGSEPTETSTQYSSPLTFSNTTTLKAKAFKTGMTASSTTSATYTKETPSPQSYNFTMNVNFYFNNIPFTVEFFNSGNVMVHAEIVNMNSGKLTFSVSQNQLPAGNYKVYATPRYFTSLNKNIILGSSTTINTTFEGTFLGGSFSQNANNTKVTIVDLALAINYFRANDASKDLDGDNKFSVSDLAIVIHSFRSSR